VVVTTERDANVAALSTAKEATAKANEALQQSKGIASRWVRKFRGQHDDLLKTQEALTKAAKDEVDRVKAAAKKEKKSEVETIQTLIKEVKDGDYRRLAWFVHSELTCRGWAVERCWCCDASFGRGRTDEDSFGGIQGGK